MKLTPELRAIAPKTKKPKKPKAALPPRVTGYVPLPVFRRIEGMRLVSGMNAHEMPFVRSNRVKEERSRVWKALGLCPNSHRFPLVVTITRISPGWLDSDNLVSSAKTVRDMIAHWLGVDDGNAERRGLVRWVVEQRKAGAGAYHVEIHIDWIRSPRRSPLEVLADWQARGCPPAVTAPSPDEVF